MRHTSRIISLLLVMLCVSQAVFADCGVTNYSGNMGRLYDMTHMTLVWCVYMLYIANTVAVIVALYSATQIYIKMNLGEEGITKSIMVLIGAILFLIGATIVMPAFFGVQYGATSWSLG